MGLRTGGKQELWGQKASLPLKTRPLHKYSCLLSPLQVSTPAQVVSNSHQIKIEFKQTKV